MSETVTQKERSGKVRNHSGRECMLLSEKGESIEDIENIESRKIILR